MNATASSTFAYPRLPVIDLLNPRRQTGFFAIMLVIGLIVTGSAMRWLGLPLWAATALVLAMLLPPAILKWRTDGKRYGRVAMVLCILMMAQGFHSLEHLAQWIQYHILRWPNFVSSGLISTLNAETVHFIWNWGVFFTIAYLVRGGMRGPWGWLLMAWISAHAFEHTYLMARYVMVLQDLHTLGVVDVGAQGLPGILGRDGWLATSAVTQGTFICRMPGLTTAVRLDVHFWWNITETLLLQLAGHFYLRQFVAQPAAKADDRMPAAAIA
jgi:hypothetical protein